MTSYSVISKTEFYVYVVIWSAGVIYSIFCFSRSANTYFQHYDDIFDDFTRGWNFLARKKDSGDGEWKIIHFLFNSLPLWLFISSAFSEILKFSECIQILQLWQVCLPLVACTKLFGVWSTLSIIIQPLIYSVAVQVKRKSFIWIFGILFVVLMNSLKFIFVYEDILSWLELTRTSSHCLIIALSWMNLRCICYTIDVLSGKEKFKLLQFFAYCLYLPNLFCGPFIPFRKFKFCYQQNEETLTDRLGKLFRNLTRFTFWIFFGDFWLHFIYVYAINYHIKIIEKFDSWSLYGYGYTMGQFFHLKYVIFYGLPSVFSEFDNVKVPTLPICIGRVHLYSDMWKYFDPGLYQFLLKYIYIPLMKNTYTNNKLFASFVTFVFIYLWHGIEYYVLIWAVLNYIGILIETFSKWIYENCIKDIKDKCKIGDKWFRRLTCIISSPLLAMSAISNFYFFAGDRVGHIFIHRIFTDKLYSTLILMAIVNCLCQVSTQLRRSNKQKKS